MFTSFFPRPKWFFLSAAAWIGLAIGLWYLGGRQLGAFFGMPPAAENETPIGTVAYFWTPHILWFYLYFCAFFAVFATFWRFFSPHPWWRWSVLGTGWIIFFSYLDVQVNVALNNWYGPFYDLVQAALSRTQVVSESRLYAETASVSVLLMVAMFFTMLNLFFVNHYVFRWRTAMNEFYTENWPVLRAVEGAAQRVQEDTMRFSTIMESLGVSLVTSVMTLIAFLPLLDRFSKSVPSLPLIGSVPHSLVVAAVLWSLFGTVFLASIGVKLPGLNFKNQRVEAAYRKELVFGEDHADRADPITLGELFGNVRKNYFRMYFHYMYFNLGRLLYLQANNLFVTIILVPTIAAGKITFGLYNQISSAFSQVSGAFQYLVGSWTTIIELISIYKRLLAFERVLYDKPLDAIEATADAPV